MAKRIFSIIGKTLLGLLGVWVAILVILEIVLSPAMTSKIISKVATEYINGDLSFSKARVSLFKRFPSLYVDIEDFNLTYPADRSEKNTFCIHENPRNSFRGFFLQHVDRI